MKSPAIHTKRIARTLQLVLLQLVLAFALSACSQSSDKDNKVVVTKDKLSAPLPAAIVAIDTDNLEVAVRLNDQTPQACNNLLVDQTSNSFSCNISLPPGMYSLALEFTVIDDVYGRVLVAASSTMEIEINSGEPTEVDFSTLMYTYFDDDDDGERNLDELYAGTDPFVGTTPNDGTCILDTSVLDNCTLG